MENKTTTIMLINKGIGLAPVLSDDLDLDDNGILDTLPNGWSIVDSVGIIDGTDGDSTDRTYGAITLRVGGSGHGTTEDGGIIVDVATSGSAMWVGRVGLSTGSGAGDWFGASLSGLETDPLNITFAASNDSNIVGMTLPGMNFGGVNYPYPVPEPSTLTLLAVGALALFLRRKTSRKA